MDYPHGATRMATTVTAGSALNRNTDYSSSETTASERDCARRHASRHYTANQRVDWFCSLGPKTWLTSGRCGCGGRGRGTGGSRRARPFGRCGGTTSSRREAPGRDGPRVVEWKNCWPDRPLSRATVAESGPAVPLRHNRQAIEDCSGCVAGADNTGRDAHGDPHGIAD